MEGNLEEKKALDTYRVLDTINKIKEFMFGDLDKTIGLVHTDEGAPNFLLALVLCCYTEFWGKLKLGEVGTKNNAECFKAFFTGMGTRYQEVYDKVEKKIERGVKKKENRIYYEVRCGLAHAYLVESNARIVIEGGHSGLEYDETTKTYTFYVRRYLDDFRVAVYKHIADIMLDTNLFRNAKKVVESKEGFQLM
jgi:hypothetical protein